MLKQLRNKKTAKKIWIILAIIILPAFVFWGLGGALRGQKESGLAGRIFGRNIPLLEYKDAFDAAKNQAIMQFGEDLSEIHRYLNLESQAWDRLVLLAEAKKRKIKASDSEVIGLIEKYPFFQRKGRFDNQIYSQALQYVFRTQPRLFEEQTRQNLILMKLYEQVTNDIKISKEEIKDAYSKLNQELSVDYIAALASDFQSEITADSNIEQEIKEYYAKNSLDFKEPPSFNLEYLSLDSQEKINYALSRLNRKQDFAKVAKDLGLELKETGEFAQTSSIPGIGWSPEILSIITKLKTGQLSPPIRVDKNHYIFRLKMKKESYIADFETIKDKVKDAFIRNKSHEIAKQRIENCLKKLQETSQAKPKSIDFNKLGGECLLKSGSTNPFKYGSYIEGIGASENFWLAGRNLNEGEFNGIIEMPTGFYIIKLKARTLIDKDKFQAEKGQLGEKVLSEKKQGTFVKFTEDLKQKARMF